ncbi:MAG: 30S ribosomal protein S5 [Candidatus Kerfeldbacteria bacterium]|nr:30S ribosomal protein S5 [Candidatus Kerfeldbacteria bacterium]
MTQPEALSATPNMDTTPAPISAAPVASPNRRNERSGGRGGYGGGQGGRGGNNQGGRGGRGGRGRGRKGDDRQKDEFESTIIDLARVTRVMAGGKRMSFRACVLVGDKKGRVGMGVMKGADVQLAVAKATEQAKKHLIHVRLMNGTIPHQVTQKFKGAQILLKPAKPGIGVIAGGPTRVVMELTGIKNIVAKMQGSKNKISNVSAVLEALRSLSTGEDIQKIKAHQ